MKHPKDLNGFKYFESLGYLPRVSTILGIISKGKFFDAWLKKEGDNADKLSAQACDTGTGLHNLLEKIGRGETIDQEITPLELKWVTAFYSWRDKKVKHFLLTEQPIYHSTDLYCGTLDALVESVSGELILIDYKTSARVYDTYYLQVSAYARALEKMRGIRLNGALILRFDKKSGEMEETPVPDLDENYDVFRAALQLWKWQNKKLYEEE
jgi:hypothetical protein